MKFVFCGLFSLLLVVYAQGKSVEEETIQLNVKRTEGNGGILQISLRVHIIDGFLHVNNHKVDHKVVTAIHLHAMMTSNGKTRPALVHVRVMVNESFKRKIKMLTIQEEIVEVDEQKVVQVDVKEIILHIGEGKNEIRRRVTSVSLKESKIHKVSRDGDKHIYAPKGLLPETPFKASKVDMEAFKNIPDAALSPPQLPDRPLRGHDELGDYEDDDVDKKRQHGRHGHGHHKHHHHDRHKHGHGHHKRWRHSFCKWFHGLPLAARVAIFTAVLLLGGCVAACCVKCFCCGKRKRLEGQKMEKKEVVDEDFDEVGPLPQKKPLDEMKLIV